MAKLSNPKKDTSSQWPTLSSMPTPIKVLFSSILITLSLGMLGALAQIIVHDIIPTFFSDNSRHVDTNEHTGEDTNIVPAKTESRGDLFSDDSTIKTENKIKSGIDKEQMIWTLKWTHIHLFGMSMIFIFLGFVTTFLDINVTAKSWLVALPFAGVVIDIAAMWLKAFVSPVFFWLHIPGGGLFALIFTYVFFKAMAEMWLDRSMIT